MGSRILSNLVTCGGSSELMNKRDRRGLCLPETMEILKAELSRLLYSISEIFVPSFGHRISVVLILDMKSNFSVPIFTIKQKSHAFIIKSTNISGFYCDFIKMTHFYYSSGLFDQTLRKLCLAMINREIELFRLGRNFCSITF